MKNKNQKNKNHISYMKQTIKLSKNGVYTTDPNPNVGCIIVNNNKIVGTGWHKKSGHNHAEIYAINMAGSSTKNSIIYISLEPCNHFSKTPPCCQAIIKSGIKHVVIATLDPNPKVYKKGIQILKKSGIKTTIGLMNKKAKNINQGFFKRIKTGIPWINVKLAISLDGKTAMQNGNSKWISSKQSIYNVHKFRAKSSAILSTSKTVLKDNAKLTVRYKKINNINIKEYNHPIRIIIDSQNKIKKTDQIIQEDIGEIWLIRLCKDNITWPSHVRQILIQPHKNQINLEKLFIFLGKKKINTVWIECGPNLFSNMLEMKLIDEIILYISPKMLGNHAQSLFLNKKKIHINNQPHLKFKNIKTIGSDIRITIKPNLF